MSSSVYAVLPEYAPTDKDVFEAGVATAIIAFIGRVLTSFHDVNNGVRRILSLQVSARLLLGLVILAATVFLRSKLASETPIRQLGPVIFSIIQSSDRRRRRL